MKRKYLIAITFLVTTITYAQVSVAPNQATQGQTLTLLVSGNVGWSPTFGGGYSGSVSSCYPYFKLVEDDAAGGGSGNDITGNIISPGNVSISIPAFQPVGPYDVEVKSCKPGATFDIITMPNSFYIGSPVSIQEYSASKKLIKVTGLLGREIKQKNQPLLYIYEDGSVEKKIIIE